MKKNTFINCCGIIISLFYNSNVALGVDTIGSNLSSFNFHSVSGESGGNGSHYYYPFEVFYSSHYPHTSSFSGNSSNMVMTIEEESSWPSTSELKREEVIVQEVLVTQPMKKKRKRKKPASPLEQFRRINLNARVPSSW